MLETLRAKYFMVGDTVTLTFTYSFDSFNGVCPAVTAVPRPVTVVDMHTPDKKV